MKITFVLNYLSHYQASLSDELFSICGDDYCFVETTPMPEDRKEGGFSVTERPYLLRAWENESNYLLAMEKCIDADVLVVSPELSAFPFKKNRLDKNKLTFEYSERPLKRGILNVFSKTNLINQWYYHTSFYKKPIYKLCAGAYVANDQYAMLSFKGRCYKFGYFPKIENQDITIHNRQTNKIKILWCARFLKWKHPEMMIALAKRLKQNGIDTEINMIGNGELYEKIQEQIKEHNISDLIHLHGNMPNEDVLKQMRQSDIFVLTSDKQEGWGAVVNEAMANGCSVVCSDAVGCAPLLINDGQNGLLFKSQDIQSLYDKVMYLITHQEERMRLSQNAYSTISEEWSPKCAAKNLVRLAHDLIEGRDTSIGKGPCSKAYPIY